MKTFFYGLKIVFFVFVAVPLYAVAVWIILYYIEEVIK